MIWSSQSINPDAGFVVQENGSAKPNKLGYPVLTLEESEKIMEARRKWKKQKMKLSTKINNI